MELDLALAASQGGGVYVGGVAHFEGCNIHDNTADNVCLHLELTPNFHPSPRLRAPPFGSQGGGVWIDFNGGVANFEGCNIHNNTAYNSVCSPSALALNFHPSPHWQAAAVQSKPTHRIATGPRASLTQG